MAAAGLPVRNGSIRIFLPSLSNSRQACPNQRTRVDMGAPLSKEQFRLSIRGFVCKLRGSEKQKMRSSMGSHQHRDSCGLGRSDLTQVIDLIVLKDFQDLPGLFFVGAQ